MDGRCCEEQESGTANDILRSASTLAMFYASTLLRSNRHCHVNQSLGSDCLHIRIGVCALLQYFCHKSGAGNRENDGSDSTNQCMAIATIYRSDSTGLVCGYPLSAEERCERIEAENALALLAAPASDRYRWVGEEIDTANRRDAAEGGRRESGARRDLANRAVHFPDRPFAARAKKAPTHTGGAALGALRSASTTDLRGCAACTSKPV